MVSVFIYVTVNMERSRYLDDLETNLFAPLILPCTEICTVVEVRLVTAEESIMMGLSNQSSTAAAESVL